MLAWGLQHLPPLLNGGGNYFIITILLGFKWSNIITTATDGHLISTIISQEGSSLSSEGFLKQLRPFGLDLDFTVAMGVR